MSWQLFQRKAMLALLHKNPDRFKVVDAAEQQAQTKGLSYVLCKVSPEAKKFLDYARQVGFEYHKATSFIRLKPIDQQRILMGEFEIRHQTAELIMQHFMRRFPTYTVMLIFGNQAYIGRDKEIYQRTIERQKISPPTVVDEYEKYWLAFYKTQFIPERKNLRYLKQMIPKKYWHWVTELGEFGLT
jgi:probable DNA metabolism protein